MSRESVSGDEKKTLRKPEVEKPAERKAEGRQERTGGLAELQRKVGNQAVQRLVQRSGGEASEIDDETTNRINSERGGGQPLDTNLQQEMGGSLGADFSDVKVHTGAESDSLNKDLGARAFTTGKDIFFKEGAYDPGSSQGKELVAHELTHVVQQGTGAVGGEGRMKVNQPGDSFEQEADSVAQQATGAGAQSAQLKEEELTAQRQEEEEEELQMQAEEEEEELQMQAEEEEEELQMQEEEEELQMQEEEEELQMQEEEEELQAKPDPAGRLGGRA
jgi:hypothetical protein